MAIEPRVNLITLAVTDIARATAFYRGLGWALSSASTPGVSFFDLNGVVLELESMLRPLIGEDVLLTTQLDPALGPIEADEGRQPLFGDHRVA